MFLLPLAIKSQLTFLMNLFPSCKLSLFYMSMEFSFKVRESDSYSFTITLFTCQAVVLTGNTIMCQHI